MAKQDVELKFSLIDGVTRSLTSIQKGVTGLGASIISVNQAAELTGKAFGLLAGAASAIGESVTGAADLETALSRVADITKATADEQVRLRESVNRAVVDVGASAEDASRALVMMAEDGFSAQEAIDNLSTVLAYAKGNAQDVASAAVAVATSCALPLA